MKKGYPVELTFNSGVWKIYLYYHLLSLCNILFGYFLESCLVDLGNYDAQIQHGYGRDMP